MTLRLSDRAELETSREEEGGRALASTGSLDELLMVCAIAGFWPDRSVTLTL